MTTPYDRVARKFIAVDKELDKLPVRRAAEKRRREEERRRLCGRRFGLRRRMRRIGGRLPVGSVLQRGRRMCQGLRQRGGRGLRRADGLHPGRQVRLLEQQRLR